MAGEKDRSAKRGGVRRIRTRKSPPTPDEVDRLVARIVAAHPDPYAAMNAYPHGEGSGFERLLRQAFCHSLDGFINASLIRTNAKVGEGRFDIELPIDYRALKVEPLFRRWSESYGLLSLIIEGKNEKRRGSVSAFRQIKDYLATAGLGRVGILVCRSGHARTTMNRIYDEALRNEFLILPFSSVELQAMSRIPSARIPEWIHQQEVILKQRASLRYKRA